MNILYGVTNIRRDITDISSNVFNKGGICKELNGDNYSLGNASFNINFTLCVSKSDEYVVSCDCLLTNKDVLSKELGLPCDVNDAELVLAAFSKWKEDIVNHIEGDFAIVVYCIESSDTWLFRDHLGIKPLYYSLTEDALCFASNFFLMVEGGLVKAEVTKESLAYMVEDLVGEKYSLTPFANIFRPLPGSYMRFYGDTSLNGKRYEEVKYWNPLKNVKVNKKRNLRQTVRELEKIVAEAVKKRGEVEDVSVHLSGGLDSSMVAGVLSSLKNEKLKAYSWSPDPMDKKYFSEDTPLKDRGSEYELLDSCCKKYPYDLKYADYKHEDLFEYFTSPEHMFMEWIEVPGLQQLKNDKVNRLLSGWGGDEFFSLRNSVTWYEYFMNVNGLFRFFYCFKKDAKAALVRLKSCLIYAFVPRPLKKIKVNSLKYHNCFIKNNTVTKNLSKDQYSFGYRYFMNTKNKLAQKRLDLNILAYRAETWNSYAYTKGVEYSFPLIDKNVIEFMFSIPTRYWVSLEYNRFITRLACRNYIPETIKKNKLKTETARMNYLQKCFDELIPKVIGKLEEVKDYELLGYVDIDKLIGCLNEENNERIYMHIIRALYILRLYNFAKKYSNE